MTHVRPALRPSNRNTLAQSVFVAFVVVEVALVGLTIWDIARFSVAASSLGQTTNDDLATIENARVAGWMLTATFAQLVVATFGFWFIVRTLRANEAAVAVAAEAIRTQERASANQHRAYVHAAAAEIEWDGNRRSCRVQFAFANTGQTPATYFEFGASFVEVAHGVRAREVSIATPEKFTRWSPIGSNDRVTAAWYEDRLAERLSAYSGPSLGSGGVVLVTGLVRYGTIFGETFETEFAFFLREAPPPNGRPTKLSRSTNAFRAYHRIDDAARDGSR